MLAREERRRDESGSVAAARPVGQQQPSQLSQSSTDANAWLWLLSGHGPATSRFSNRWWRPTTRWKAKGAGNIASPVRGR
ncbi:hypothetical protein AXG93_4620s2050 [Marchantia polymorpha subsp. ruderalis]|uniref:Uncharacterized protein n=1 Tax=Marchantia polymorpha subsp. ruderalis TaxID=1480154 RepID=A0A176VX59_MARPO|nr:hypothetical protein AXG93_4620s2050 [Marchantia polymorpha subsp. ruderalis]